MRSQEWANHQHFRGRGSEKTTFSEVEVKILMQAFFTPTKKTQVDKTQLSAIFQKTQVKKVPESGFLT